MRIIVISFLILSQFVYNVFGKELPSVQVEFKYYTTRDFNIAKDTLKAELYQIGKKSRFVVQAKEYVPGTLYVENGRTQGEVRDVQYEVFKNFELDLMLSQARIKYNYNTILNEKISSSIKVKLVDKKDVRKLLGYTCYKALVEFKGRDYEVYFTKEIPINNGPWKIHGLGGLILSVKETKGLLSIEATKLTLNYVSDQQLESSISNKESISWNRAMIDSKKAYRLMQKKMLECCENKPEIRTPNSLEKYDLNEPETYELRYDVWATVESDNKQVEKTLTTEFKLIANESHSNFEYVKKVLNIQGLSTFSLKDQDGVIHRNLIDSTFIHNRELEGKKFLIKDNFKVIPWKITNRKKKHF